MTAIVVHPSAAALDLDAALVLPLQNLAVEPSSALPVDFPSFDRYSSLSAASQIVAVWESGQFPMRDWIEGSWNQEREGVAKFKSSAVTERAQQYCAVRLGLSIGETPEACLKNATGLKQCAAQL